MKTRSLPWRLIAICSLAFVLLCAIAIGFGLFAGKDLAETHQRRLTAVWPDLMALPQQDRAVLAWLSMECKLANQPEGRTQTIACLRGTASTAGVVEPMGDVNARLDLLLQRAPRPPATGGTQG